ncbi:MAG: hypothetical protein GX335_03435 [Firmicutes bacterium]|nr:hypothetical protein [Bacillota bacterium]
MADEKRIKEALEINSRWSGSADQLWARISPRLRPKGPWRQQRQFWLGTAAAALLILAFFLKAVQSPLPPPAEPEENPQLRSFSALPEEEALLRAPGETIEFTLQVFPAPEGQQLGPPLLAITRLEEDQEPFLVEEIILDLEILGEVSGEAASFTLALQAPGRAGFYHYRAQGSFQQDGIVYNLQGAMEVEVQED